MMVHNLFESAICLHFYWRIKKNVFVVDVNNSIILEILYIVLWIWSASFWDVYIDICTHKKVWARKQTQQCVCVYVFVCERERERDESHESRVEINGRKNFKAKKLLKISFAYDKWYFVFACFLFAIFFFWIRERIKRSWKERSNNHNKNIHTSEEKEKRRGKKKKGKNSRKYRKPKLVLLI